MPRSACPAIALTDVPLARSHKPFLVEKLRTATCPERPGKLVVFEGIDGCGKGTMIDIMRSDARFAGATYTKSPGGSPLGEAIRRTLFVDPGTREIDNDALELLFLANHIHNVNRVIIPALDRGEMVVCDRHWPSAFAYMDRRGASPRLRQLYSEFLGPRIDVMFLMVGDPEMLLRRAQARTSESHQAQKKWNDATMLRDVQEEFLDRYAHEQWCVLVDVSTDSPAGIFEAQVLPHLERM